MKRAVFLFAALAMCWMSVSMAVAQKAGQGSYQPVIVKRDGAAVDTTPFDRAKHYVRVEAARWFVNQQGDVLKDRMVSGTVDLSLGNETYQSVLGTYELAGGNQTAPVFNAALLNNRAYTNGGTLKFVVFMKGIKRDTLLGGLLKDVATSALGVATSKVGTVTTLGTSQVLTSAGQALLGGVQGALNKGEKQHGIFEQGGGLTFEVPMESFVGNEFFVLAYRGNPLDQSKLKVVFKDGVFDLLVDTTPLRQGAWVLFRVERKNIYGTARPWEIDAARAQGDLDDLMQNWSVNAKTQAAVATELTPTLTSNNVADRMLAVRAAIRADEALTKTEKNFEAGKLVGLLASAQLASKTEKGYEAYFKDRDDLEKALQAGTAPQSQVVKNAIVNESALISAETQLRLVKGVKERFSRFRDALGGSRFESIREVADLKSIRDSKDLNKLNAADRKSFEDAVNSVSSDGGATDVGELWSTLGVIKRDKAAKQ